MTLDEIIKKRRSIRSFQPTPVASEDLLAICEAARLAPSACNSQTWRFVAVTDSDTIKRLCNEAMRPVIPNRWLAQAPLVIIGCSQLDMVANRIGSRISGIEYYQIDLGIAMEHMVLKATELGLGTCWIGWFSEDRVKEILGIPKKIKVSAMLTIGYPKETPLKRQSRKTINKILFSEKWGQLFVVRT
ncbi:MAG: nitroreductase family protein [Deltaproteobacteria bacterium]|nr:nitroreductase family protein [Deltaproteobacteria bacterium]MBW1960438.1 nitroreductase family protein [Deltaproteobacteria bacterium]MBW2151424.1 nitroreductase family protein [Deltaproteobacteria bacterium]